MKIIGVGGLPRSGKDTVADYLIANGYFGVSFGDIVRDYAKKRHHDKPDPISVRNMTETSNWLRKNNGSDFAMKEALNLYQQAGGDSKYKGLVTFSIRAPIEVDFILRKGGELVWIEASDKVRFERAMKNLRKGELAISFDEFKAQENLQNKPQPGIPNEIQMNTSYVKSKATVLIENNEIGLSDLLSLVKSRLHIS